MAIEPINPQAQALVRSYVERIERLNLDIKDAQADLADTLASAREAGLNVALLKKAVAIRAKDPGQKAEEDAVVDLYLSACAPPARGQAVSS